MAMNHVAANLLMLVLVLGGIIMAPSIKQEIFPEVSLDRVSVSVAYPGAGPEEVEEGIVIKIEESLTAVDGIKQLKATANEGFGTVIAEVYANEDIESRPFLKMLKSLLSASYPTVVKSSQLSFTEMSKKKFCGSRPNESEMNY